jgi:uncharacterized membrane protein YqjE
MTDQLGQPGQPGAHTAAGRAEAYPAGSGTASEDRSLGSIVSDMTSDLSTLVHQEMELARTELKQEATRAGKGAGMLGGAALAGYLTLLFLSLFVMFVLADWWDDYKWAALAITVLWGIAAAVLAMIGKKKLQEARPELPVTQQSLKEDVQWAKAQKS